MTVDSEAPALTGGLKTIYGMLVELKDGRIAERASDAEFMTDFRANCKSTIDEYTGKIDTLDKSIKADAITSAAQAVIIEDETKEKGDASKEKGIVETALTDLTTAHKK